MSASAGSAGRTAVFYYVPEDGDEEDHPNFFTIGRAANKVRLGDVKKAFPLPGGYHFRFKKTFKSTFVWLDVLDDYDVVPRFDGQIVAKVSRLSAPRGSCRSGKGPAFGAAAADAQTDEADSKSKSRVSGTRSQVRAPAPAKLNAKSSSNDLLGLHSPTQPQASHQPADVSSSDLGGATTDAVTKSIGDPTAALHSMSASFVSGVPLSSASSTSSTGGGGMMDLDWSAAVPSPSPSPPPTISQQPSPMRNGSANSLNQQRSVSPLRRPQPVKQNLQVPSDLSSAAKDFRL